MSISIASKTNPSTRVLTVDVTSLALRGTTYDRDGNTTRLGNLDTFVQNTGQIVASTGALSSFNPIAAFIHPQFSPRKAQISRIVMNQIGGGGRYLIQIIRMPPFSTLGFTFSEADSRYAKDYDDGSPHCYVVSYGSDAVSLTATNFNPALHSFDIPGSQETNIVFPWSPGRGESIDAKPLTCRPNSNDCYLIACIQLSTVINPPKWNLTFEWTEGG